MISFPNCKINLGLYVTEKREDGYHSIESIFVPVPLNDVLEIVPSENGQFELFLTGSKETIDRENNICWKALMLLRSDFELVPSAIYLHKNIPSGAGLGGGSADGAFALKLFNSYYKLNLSVEVLKEYAAILGSDCPFFIENKIQFVSGRGEVMHDLDLNLSRTTIVVIHPSIHVSTKEAYSLINPKRASLDLKQINTIPRSEWKSVVRNDFETPLISKFPVIREIKEGLYDKGAFYASMSGSGSAVYGLFENDVEVSGLFEPHFCWKGML
ncbi:MAG: 4-(cytidine 5'-diphospho)-2-C-methyl-D-erythritol kinase [Flavobacteriales bacterium]